VRSNLGRITKKAFPAYSVVMAAVVAAFLLLACGGGDDSSTDGSGKLSGSIVGDGSSTVFPITEAVAEEFRKVEPDIDVVAGISGTGGGFKKFCNGEIDFNDASRKIKDEEKQACADKGIEWVEFQVGYDGISLVTNPDNDFAQCLTVAELKSIWEPGSEVNNWADVRPDFPDKSLKLYGPDTDSGTFDYFTDEVVGEEGSSRPDYTASADDNVLVQGIEGDKSVLGYFGYAYYEENSDKLSLVAVDGGNGCVLPSPETILSGEYKPLSRPLFLYVREDILERPEVAAFLRYYLTEGRALVAEVGYVEAPDSTYEEGLAKLPQQ
jgi:phosphate transport system substrate-binding protein